MSPKPGIAVAFAAAAAALAFAASASGTDVTISRPITAGNARLAPGEYRVVWNATALGTTIQLSRGSRIIATVPAQLSLRRRESGSSLLVRIDWSRLTPAG